MLLYIMRQIHSSIRYIPDKDKKLLYLVIRGEITKKRTMPLQKWSLTISQLYIRFGIRLHLNQGELLG